MFKYLLLQASLLSLFCFDSVWAGRYGQVGVAVEGSSQGSECSYQEVQKSRIDTRVDEAALDFKNNISKILGSTVFQDNSIQSLYQFIQENKDQWEPSSDHSYSLLKTNGESLPVGIEKGSENRIFLSFGVPELIGEGNSKVVYKMYELEKLKKIAKSEYKEKKISDGSRHQDFSELQKEIEIIKKINRPGETKKKWMVDVYSSNDKRVYSEFFDGDLVDFVQREGYFLKDRNKHHFKRDYAKLDIALQMLQGMEEMHHLGIVHSDIKLGNFLISEVAEYQYQVAFIDFGLSFDVNALLLPKDSSGIDPVIRGGTFHFAAPEVFLPATGWLGGSNDEKIENAKKRDVYSMAVSLAVLFGFRGLVPWLYGACDHVSYHFGFSAYLECRAYFQFVYKNKISYFSERIKREMIRLLLSAMSDEPSSRINAEAFRKQFEEIKQRYEQNTVPL